MKECYKPKTSYEIQKASEEYIFKTNIDDANVQDHFIAGAEWMLDNPTGGALLYAVVKTTERTKRETLIKVEKFLIEYFCNSHYAMPSIEFGIFMKYFKEAMQDENKDI